MATDIKMPQLSDTMNAGKILAWRKKEGDVVARGDILAEVETEKANLEIECFSPGTLLKILIPEQSSAAVGEVICVIGQPGEQVSNGAASAAPKPSVASAPTPTSVASSPSQTHPAPTRAVSAPDRVVASPLAKKIAADKRIDLSQVQGTGPNGRIVRRDLEGAAANEGSLPTATGSRPSAVRHSEPRASSTSPSTGGGRLTPLSKMRETIARRMQESVTEAPHFYTTTSVRMDQALKLREALKERPEFKGISVNHLVIKAVANALARERSVNCAFRDGGIFEPDGVNVGIITAVDGGLLIPVIKDADTLSLQDVVFESRAAVERAKAGRPNSSDLLGGTFSISNMGMFDVESFTAIINPGQGGVLAVSSVKEVPVVEKGVVMPGMVMRATVSVDHRIIDGVMAATFLKHFKEALEIPGLLMS